MGITTVPAFVPADTASRLAALESADVLTTFMTNAKALISGGGAMTVDTGYNVKWPIRFLVMGGGRSTALCPAGHFSIAMPAVGTVIPRVGGDGSSVTVTAAGINFNAYDSLYYILPLGSDQTSKDANFRIVQYTSDFAVPPTWLPIVTRNSTETPETVKWTTGVSMTPWAVPTLTNAVNYGAGYEAAGYCRRNGTVQLKGLLNSITIGVLFTLPVGFRPLSGTKIFMVQMGTAPQVGRVDVLTTGSVTCAAPAVAGTWLSLENVIFPADA